MIFVSGCYCITHNIHVANPYSGERGGEGWSEGTKTYQGCKNRMFFFTNNDDNENTWRADKNDKNDEKKVDTRKSSLFSASR